jgi:ElaB/YqjD/DUF883 family membrane-anchored ribosome-binding protein
MRQDFKEEIAHEIGDAVTQLIKRVGADRIVASSLADGRAIVRDNIHRATEYAGDLADDARAESIRVARRAAREMRDHPLATLAVGAALGTIFGILVSQSSRSRTIRS